MADASYARSSFIGGEWSKLAQGRYHDPSYVKAMNVCLNGLPIESESWVRRPGFGFAATTRSGAAGRVIPFNFNQNAPYTMEFTDAHLRFFSGQSLVTLNDSVQVSAITTANPAVVQTLTQTWDSNDQVFFTTLGSSCPLLQNRLFTMTRIDNLHLSLRDAITGATIDGATLGVGSLAGTTMINRVRDAVTPYVGTSWESLRSVQAEAISFLLHASFKPYAVDVVSFPTSTNFASLQFLPAVFNDGPYLDPVGHGATITPSGLDGLINLTISFTTYVATKAYARGDFVLSAGLNYQSLIDANLGNTPAISPTAWVPVSAGVAVGPNGFVGTDVGRLIRLFSEPQLWTIGTAYVVGNIVSFVNDNGNTTYYTCLTNNTAAASNAPGVSLTTWGIYTPGAIWSWGRITALSSQISQTLGGTTNIGDMNVNGGLAAAFDGVTVQDMAHSAAKTFNIIGGGPQITISSYIGRNYTVPGAQQILSATLYPASDNGLILNTASSAPISAALDHITVNLRANVAAPGNATDGVLLGTITIANNTTQAISINSNDSVTAYNYVWFEIIAVINDTIAVVTMAAAECQFFSASGGGSNGVTLQILGPPLLYTIPVRIWRLGLYSDTTGWPTCGTYSDGRLWLSGAVANRIDSSVSNGIVSNGLNGVSADFAPTDKFGNVLASSAISYVFNADDVNPIFWMVQELQGIVCGTKSGEWVVQAPTTGGITPFNISARRMTRVGCANIEPRRTEHTTVFVQKFGRKIIEYFADVFSGKFTAPNLTVNAKHLTLGGIQELAYQQELCPTIWARVDGSLIGCTYKRDTLMTSQGPTMFGWHPVTLGSGRIVESITVSSSVGGNLDALIMVTNDPATGIRHVEVMGDILDEGSALSQAAYLDDAMTPTSIVSNSLVPTPYGGLTLNGLWHLNNKTVQAWLGGLDCGDYVVVNGSITVPYGDGVSAGTANGLFTIDFVTSFNPLPMPMTVGFTYTSRGQLTRPHTREESGARAGPALGKVRRNQWLFLQFEGTQGVSLGTTFDNLRPALFKDARGNNLLLNAQFSGMFRDQFIDDYSFDGMLCWQITRPYICNIAAAGASLQTMDT